MTHAQAIVFEAPQNLSVKTQELKGFEAGDLEVEIGFSGISTGTERLLWDGTMPPFPGLGYPLVPGCETVGTVVRVAPEWGPKAVLLALTATCYHTVSLGGQRQPMVATDLIVGHGVVGRRLARITLALGMPAPMRLARSRFAIPSA